MNQYTRYASLKAVIEELFGSESWYALKGSNHLPTWKNQLQRVIGAIHTSILATVEIHDEEWINQINDAIEHGNSNIKSATDIEEAISALSAAFINISFLQVGFMPKRKGMTERISLKKENWRLNSHRTVMYLQTAEQKESIFWGEQQKEIGVQSQRVIWLQYRKSKSKISYSKWCREINK